MNDLDYRNLAVHVVALARRKTNLSEAFLSNSQELTIEVRNQEVEAIKFAHERGLGLRVIVDGRMGFAYTSDLSADALNQVTDQALANATQTAADPYNQLPAPVTVYPQLNLFDPGIGARSVETKIALAKEIEKAGKTFDPRIKITESCTYRDAAYDITLANSLGICTGYQGAFCGAYAFLVAEENGSYETGFGMQFSLRYADLDAGKVGREAALKAVRMLGAKNIKTQKLPVIFDPYVATNFLGLIAPGLTAEAVQKGKSLFAERIGQQVASTLVTIIDNGALPGGMASSPFDGEGVPTGKTVLIETGVLQNYLYNTYTAAKDGAHSTGNGTRGSFRGTPEVGITNFFIQPGESTPEALIKDTTMGLFVTEVMGMHTANPISGDFSVGAAGILIKNGELTTPVRGVVIAGNIIGLLEAVDAVGQDLVFYGGVGAPTIRVAGLTVSGGEH